MVISKPAVVKIPQQIIDDVVPKPRAVAVSNVPTLNRNERRRLRFAARRVVKHLATLPGSRRASLRQDYREIYDQQRDNGARA